MSSYGRDRLPVSLVTDIENAVQQSGASLAQIVANSGAGPAGRPLVIKYMPTKYGAMYVRAGSGLRISDRPGFTWGTGVYLTALCYPVSTGIYGRAGVVSWYDPAGWRCFDATVPGFEALFVSWLHLQPTLRDILVTVHSDYHNHLLRNLFREQFHVDCVLFHPDEQDSAGTYTAGTDVWMAVGEFDAKGELMIGTSRLFHDARLTVILEEEFDIDSPPLTRSAVLKLTATRTPNAVLVADIVGHYQAVAGWTRVSS
jgi:hypothetical protein